MNPKIVSILKGSAIAAVGAGLAYAAAAFTGSDFGWGPAVGGLLAILANIVRKLAMETPNVPTAILAAVVAGGLGCSVSAKQMPATPEPPGPTVASPPLCERCGKHCSGIQVHGYCLPVEKECGDRYHDACSRVEEWRRKRLEWVGHTDWSPYYWAQSMQAEQERAQWEKECWYCAWYIVWPQVTPQEQADWYTRLEKLMGVAE